MRADRMVGLDGGCRGLDRSSDWRQEAAARRNRPLGIHLRLKYFRAFDLAVNTFYPSIPKAWRLDGSLLISIRHCEVAPLSSRYIQ